MCCEIMRSDSCGPPYSLQIKQLSTPPWRVTFENGLNAVTKARSTITKHMAADMETVKSADKLARSISAMSGKVSRPGSISPARTPFSPTLMELDEYR